MSAFQDMGFDRYYKRFFEEGRLIGFLAGFLQLIHTKIPRDVRTLQERHTYSGFWRLEDDAETRSADMFGGPALLGRLQDFLEAPGGEPIYIGWGSCTSPTRGSHHMVTLAVGALRVAGVRGIILAGWAGLNEELLREAVGPEDCDGLYAYATAHVLFVDKAPRRGLLTSFLLESSATFCERL